MLRRAGLEFDEVEPREWVHRLRASNPDPRANPPIRPSSFWTSSRPSTTGTTSPRQRRTSPIRRGPCPPLWRTRRCWTRSSSISLWGAS
ncbi:hypothetical protein F5X96DRAFT_659867 [Biscogniauxia mediterranea]|nr:hypothetical protein F5X96DRAFT_659867 [Biscogniauxia mediterranea]